MKHFYKPALVLFFVTVAASVQATLLYYDGFPVTVANAYPVDRVANNANPQHASIVGFKDNSANIWRAGSTAIRISNNNLEPPTAIKLAAQDGCFSVGEGSGNPRAGFRNIVSPALTGTTYYSFLVKYKGTFPEKFTNVFVSFDTIGVQGTASPDLNTFGENGFVVAFVRQDSSRVDLVLKTDTDMLPLVENASAGETYMVVAKYVNNPDDVHEVMASIITEPIEPETWDAAITTPERSQTINKMCIGGFGANSTVDCFFFDEIRIGTTFQDVAGLAGSEPAVFDGVTTVSNIAVDGNAASATFSGTLSNPGDPVADIYLYWGLEYGGISDPLQWANTNFIMEASALTITTNMMNFPADSMIFYRLAAVTELQKIWSTPDPAAFLTAPLSVSSTESVLENSLEPASFVISRPDNDDACTTPLKVNFSLDGSALEGVHYTASSTDSVEIPADSSSASVSIFPIPDFRSSDDLTVVLTVEEGAYAMSATATGVLQIVNVPAPDAPTNAFIAAVSDLASEPQNWSLGRVPSESDEVLFSLMYSRSNLHWDEQAPAVVGSWNQTSENTNTVFFSTKLDAPLAILGDVTLDGGAWTHTGPSNAPVYSLAVDVGGNLSIGAGAAINVGRDISGIDPSGNTRGFYRDGPGYLFDTGSSYGGEGFTNAITYGSVINPLSYGSSARGSGGAAALLKYSGGGLVRLRVAGELSVFGRISADGYGYGNNGGGGTGGTLNIEAGTLLGDGFITANGGNDAYYGPGSGGRIRIRLTEASASSEDFGGTLSAFGGTGGAPGSDAKYDTAGGAAGTIAWQNAAMQVDEAIVMVFNHDKWRAMTNLVEQFNPSTHLPPLFDTDKSFGQTDWIVGDNGKVRLTKNVTIRGFEMLPPELESSLNPVLYLDESSLTVTRLEVDGIPFPAGKYEADAFPEDWVVGSGYIIVPMAGTVLTIK